MVDFMDLMTELEEGDSVSLVDSLIAKAAYNRGYNDALKERPASDAEGKSDVAKDAHADDLLRECYDVALFAHSALVLSLREIRSLDSDQQHVPDMLAYLNGVAIRSAATIQAIKAKL